MQGKVPPLKNVFSVKNILVLIVVSTRLRCVLSKNKVCITTKQTLLTI